MLRELGTAHTENQQTFQLGRVKARSTRSGFTLVEILIVVAIIGILAAILFPAFSRAREQARKSTCLSNLRQIGMGTLQYTQDYDEHFPIGFPFWETTFLVSPDQYLANVMKPYVALPVWNCPSWQGVYKPIPNSPGNYSFLTGNGSIGLFNEMIGVPNITPPGSLSQLQQPSVYPLFFCGAAPSQLGGEGKMNAHSGITDARWEQGGVGGTSIVYGDGHAKYIVMSREQWNKIFATSP